MVDQNAAGQNQRLCFLPRIGQTAIDQQLIQPLSGLPGRSLHAVRWTIKSASSCSQCARSPKLREAFVRASQLDFGHLPSNGRCHRRPGNVIFPCCASLPAVLPRASDGCSTSRISSTI